MTDPDAVEYKLFHGDTLLLMSELPPGSVDCCITSPPYWLKRKYEGNSSLGNEATVEEYVSNLVARLNKLRGVLKPEGSLWLNIGDSYKDKNLVGVPWRVALALQSEGWILRNAIVWDKIKGNPCNAKDKLRNVYEMVFHFVLQSSYYYNLDELRNAPQKPHYQNGHVVTPTGVSGIKYRKQINESKDLSSPEKVNALVALEQALLKVEMGEMPDFRMIIRGTQRSTHSESVDYSGRADELQKKGFCILPYHKNGTKPGDIWRIVPEDEWRIDKHFAVFPKELCETPLKATCPPNGVVLDPFCGTGTTLVSALEMDRKAFGIDTSEEYLRVAQERIEAVLQAKSKTGQQLSLF